MSNETAEPRSVPRTIVLVHGLWVTPRRWEKWIDRYRGLAYQVLAPAYPGLEVEVEALNEDPAPIEPLTECAVVERDANVVRKLKRPPILVGRSLGGLVVRSHFIIGQPGWQEVADYALSWATEAADHEPLRESVGA